MKIGRVLRPLSTCAVLAGLAIAAYSTREHWLPVLMRPEPPEPTQDVGAPAAPANKVIVNDQAQENLGLTAKLLKPQTCWKTIPVPGMVVDRPGLSDRGITAPATGVVFRIHRVPGETVRPGEALFTINLLSESLQTAQIELLKSTLDLKFAHAQRKSLVATVNAVPGSRIVEVDNQILRLEAGIAASRRELLLRGLSPESLDGISEGKFVNEITVSAPPVAAASFAGAPPVVGPSVQSQYELEELKVELGQQVQAGQVLCRLARHEQLAIEGRAFRDETPLLEKSVKENWPVEVDFQEDAAAGWGEIRQVFRVRHLANTIDPLNRTFAFTMLLENESRAIQRDGHKQMLWRFRPGQKVRLLIRVEEMKNVFVLPADAVSREGPEAFIFTQNVNTFERRPVRILLQDRQQIVLANDNSLPPGSYVVQSGAAQLSRMVKAGGSGGAPKGYHIHADGSLHKNEDEGK
ncbi:MAG: hypothetical protein U0791_06090 [Gemmataceae bacterium]